MGLLVDKIVGDTGPIGRIVGLMVGAMVDEENKIN